MCQPESYWLMKQRVLFFQWSAQLNNKKNVCKHIFPILDESNLWSGLHMIQAIAAIEWGFNLIKLSFIYANFVQVRHRFMSCLRFPSLFCDSFPLLIKYSLNRETVIFIIQDLIEVYLKKPSPFYFEFFPFAITITLPSLDFRVACLFLMIETLLQEKQVMHFRVLGLRKKKKKPMRTICAIAQS